MNSAEAQLELHGYVKELLIDLAVEDDLPDDEMEAVEEAMADLADLMFEGLDLKVTNFSEKKEGLELSVRMTVPRS